MIHLYDYDIRYMYEYKFIKALRFKVNKILTFLQTILKNSGIF